MIQLHVCTTLSNQLNKISRLQQLFVDAKVAISGHSEVLSSTVTCEVLSTMGSFVKRICELRDHLTMEHCIKWQQVTIA